MTSGAKNSGVPKLTLSFSLGLYLSEKHKQTYKSLRESTTFELYIMMILPPGQAKVNDFNLVSGSADTKNVFWLKSNKREGL